MKKVLVTGASSGIGEAVCRYLSGQGYYVVLLARNEERLRKVSGELPNESKVIFYDLKNLENIEQIFERCTIDGKLSGFVHCAGVNRNMPVKMNDVDDMIEVMTINYYSFIELAKYFYKKKYSEQESSIVAVSSIAAQSCDRGENVYSSSKAALNAAVKVMAKEFSKRKFTVNSIMPAYVDTPMLTNLKEQGNLEELTKGQTLGIMDPIQIAYLIEFLLSDKSRCITGTNIPITAGYSKI